MTLDTLLNMLKEITAARDAFVVEANNRLAYYNGKIETIQEMVDALTEKVPEEVVVEQE